jgi:hypothetical protein
MRNYVRLCSLVLLACAAAYAGYRSLSAAPSREDQSILTTMDPFGPCTEASLDRRSGETRLGYCPVHGVVTLTAGLP